MDWSAPALSAEALKVRSAVRQCYILHGIEYQMPWICRSWKMTGSKGKKSTNNWRSPNKLKSMPKLQNFTRTSHGFLKQNWTSNKPHWVVDIVGTFSAWADPNISIASFSAGWFRTRISLFIWKRTFLFYSRELQLFATTAVLRLFSFLLSASLFHARQATMLTCPMSGRQSFFWDGKILECQ